MGAGQSASQSDSPPRGLHVLRVTPASPASRANIEPFFDFVVGFEGDSLSTDKAINVAELENIVESHENRTLNLLIWNSKNQQTRVVPIIPSRVWSQQHPNHDKSQSNSQPSLLGLSMRVCNPETATENVWHVLDVLEGSPAESAGLVPMGDWILGWSGGALGAENDFYDLVEAHIDKPLRVYVYSYDFDTLREVVLIPNRHWGGEGLLGCVFGFGLLHRIPPQPEGHVPGAIPPELQEPREEYESQDLFIPAEIEGNHHSSAQLAEWRQQEQEQWNHEVTARAAHPRSPLGQSNTLQTVPPRSHTHSPSALPNSRPPSRVFSPAAAESAPRTRTPLSHLMNGQPMPLRSPSFSEYSPRHSSQNGYISAPSLNSRPTSTSNAMDSDLDDDGQTSVAETEDTSHGSLTSVE